MNLLKQRSIRFYLGFFLILTMAIGGSAIAAFADSGTATVGVTAGNFTESGVTNVTANSVTLDGTDKTTSYTLGINVNDNTGSGNGWNLTITSTQFDTAANCGSGHTLDTGASTVTNATPATNGTGTYTSPSNSVSYAALTVPAACPSAPTPVEIFNAASGSGLGQFTITPTIQIAIPANTYAGTYTSTVTIALNTGP